jgi:hypothetical protein
MTNVEPFNSRKLHSRIVKDLAEADRSEGTDGEVFMKGLIDRARFPPQAGRSCREGLCCLGPRALSRLRRPPAKCITRAGSWRLRVTFHAGLGDR